MASLDDVLKGNLRGFRRETGQPVEEIAVEKPAIDEVEPPQLYDERAEYRGFKVPAGMDAEQTERWFGAIDAREDEREAAEAEAEREAEAKFEAESGFSRQLLGSLERTVMKDNPRMGAKAIEGLGRVAGSQAMIDFGTKTAAEYDTSDDPASFTPRIGSIYDAEGFQDYIDYAGSTLGQGLGSIATTIAGGVVGAGVGAAATAPFGGAGAAPGFRAGLLGSGFIQAYGSMYETLVDEQGVDPDIAAKYAIPFGVAMAVAERAGVEEVLKPARDQLSKNFAKRTAQLALRGGAAEGVTEGIQQVIQETAGEFSEVLGFASKDIDLGQRVRNTIESVIGGFLPGVTLGATGAARVRPEDDAPAPPVPEEIVSANMEEVPSQPVRVTAALTGVQDARPDLSRMKDMYLELSNEIAEAESKKQDASALKLDLDSLEVAIFGDFESSLRDILGRDGDIEIARFDRGIGGWAGQSLEPNLRVELVGDEATILSRLTEFNATSGMSGPDVVPQGGALNRVLVEALLDVPDVIASYDPENVEQNKKLVWYDNGAERLATLRIQLPPEMVTPQFLAGMGDVFAQDSLGFTVDRENSTIELIHTPEWSVTDAKQTLDSFVRAARLIQKVAQKRFGKDIGIEWLKERIEISEPSSGVKTVKNGFTEGESRYILKGYQELLKDEDRREARAAVRGEAPVPGRRSRPDEKDRVKPEARKRGVSVEATNDAVSEAAASNRSLSNLPTYEQFVFGGDGREGSFGLDRLHERAEQARSKVDDDVSRGLMSRMGLQFEDRDTSAELKIYPLQDKFGSTVNQVISRLKEWTDTEGTVGEGWTFTIFGPSFAKSGKKIGFIKPDFKNNGYAQKNAYIYQPYDPNGAFDDVAYTYAWRATHEIAHGLVNDKLTEQYGGQGRRAGALGILAIDDGGKNIMDPLSLSDALRALDWEHETFLKQREILEQDFGITISEDEFNREYMLNMSDAVHRVLTGRFSNPGELGAVPISEDPAVVLERAKDTVRQAARAMGMDMSERADGPQEIVTPQTSEGQQYVGLGGLSVEEAIEASKSISTGVELAEFIIENADNKDYKEIAKRLIPHLEDTDVHTLTGELSDIPQWVFESEKQGTLSANIVNSLAGMSAHHSRLLFAIKGLNISRPGDPYNDVFIRGRPVYSGANAETMLHELIHAATVRRQADGNLAANAGTKLQKAASKIIDLRNDVVRVAIKAQRDGSLDSDMQSILERATENEKEFVAYGMTNKKFQEFLMTIKSKNKSIWNRFVEAVAGLLGISKDNQTALSDLILATDELLSAPLDEVPLRQMTESIEMMSRPSDEYLQKDVQKKLTEAINAGAITREEAMEARREWFEKGTDSSFFKKWFKDSVVVDSKGKPLRILHGTPYEFNVFQISGDRVGLYGQGVYTTLSPNVANDYAGPARNRHIKEIIGPPTDRYPVGGKVITGYASIQNPVFSKDPVDMAVAKEIQEWMSVRQKGDFTIPSDGSMTYIDLLNEIENAAYSSRRNPNVEHTSMQRALDSILKRNGYDGVINSTKKDFEALQKKDFDGAPQDMHIVVLTPNQFKSDTGNLGTFSLADDEIFFQREEIPGAQYFSDEAFNLAQEEARPQGSRFIVGEIAVDDFLALAAEGMEEPKAKRVADLVEGGTKFNTLPLLEFDKSGKVITHEGRHRARALKELGVERMPILFESENIRWQKQSDPRERVEFPKFLIGQDSDFKIKFPFEQSVDPDSIRDIMDDLNLFEDDAEVQESMKKRVGSSDIDSMTDDQLAKLFDQLMAGRIAASKVPKPKKLNREQMKKLMDRYSAGTSQGAPEPLTRKAKKKDGSDIKPVTKATKLKTSAEGFRRGDARTELLNGRNPIDTDADWDQWWGGITGTDQVLEPPYKIRSYVDPQNIASELAKLTPEQKRKASEGINLVDEIGFYYKSGLITGDITAKLLAWSILSRSLSAFPHESAFLDAYISQPTYDMFQRDFGYFIEAALNGQFDERIAEEYDVWVGGVHRIRVCNKWLSEGVITQDEYDSFVGQHKPTIDALLADGVIDKKQAEGFLVDPEGKKANEEHASARQLAETLRRDGKITDEQFRLLVGFHPALKIEGMGNPALSNLRDFGNQFLRKSSELVPKGQKLIGFKGQEYDFSGQTKLEAWHNILVNQEISGQEARRLYHQLYESAGIDNKVISFQLLVAGRTDVTVIDRIQANHFWDAAGGSLGKKVLYKDGTKIDLYEGFSTPGTDGAWQIWSRNPRPFSPARGLADVLSGVRGAILYEAIENSILRNLEEGYRLAGREGEASIGRFHWETWVINSGQEVGHDTLNVILKELRGEADPAVGAFVREGKFQMRRYGMKYVVLPGNETAMVMETQDGQNYLFNRSQWANLSDKLKKDGSNVKTGDLPRIVPRGWRLTNERFENTPWYNRASVNRDNLDIAIREFGTPATDEQSLAIQRFADRAGVDDTTGVGEQGNPLDTVGPVILSQRVDSPVDMVVMYTDDVSRSKAELDRRREIANKYDPMLFELMKMEADFYEMDDRSEEAKALGNQYEDLLKQYANIDDELFADEHERFLKGDDFYYETMEEGLEDFDVDRAFNVMTDAQDIEMDIDLRRTQEMMQRKRFDRMMDRGGTLVDLAGKNSPINRLIIQKAKAFNHPVQTVQLIESDKMQLQQDLSNVEELKEDGLISYLLYKELKGDVMLF